jgi:protein-disulfide isomerase
MCALLLLAAGCAERPKSQAADVDGRDVRRLPPDRADLPDITLGAADRGRTIGSDSAKVTVLVVSDYQCSGCKSWFETVLPELRASYIDRGTVRLVWTHYPLRAHAGSVAAASAAMCAAAQGKFWDASANLFANQARWAALADPVPLLDSLASVPGTEGYALSQCTATKRMFRQIRKDIDWVDSKDAGRPLLLMIGGRTIEGAPNLSVLRATLDSLISAR